MTLSASGSAASSGSPARCSSCAGAAPWASARRSRSRARAGRSGTGWSSSSARMSPSSRSTRGRAASTLPGHDRRAHRRAVPARRLGGDARAGHGRSRHADRRRPADRPAPPRRRERRRDQPGVPRPPARLHRDRDQRDRPAGLPRPRPEAADLHRRRPAGRRARRPDRDRRAAPRRGALRDGLRGDGHHPARGRLLPGRVRGVGDARPDRLVPQPRRRPGDRAAAHPALRAHPRRAPRVRPRDERARRADRRDRLRRGAPRAGHRARGDPRPAGLPRLPVHGPGDALRAGRAGPRAARDR